uniref:C-type lectin domain-containing protein n=1 Tax=Sinocyclocheilus anshuiensis TaxID=1608454 RepID=A0A671K1W1_9TELE
MDFDYLKSKWHIRFPKCIPLEGMVLKTEYFSSAFPLSNAKGRLREFQLINGRITRTLAVNACRTNYTDLATVYDQQDNIQLRTLLINVPDPPTGWIVLHVFFFPNFFLSESFIHVSPDEMSWEEALDYCNSNFSGLLRIESEDDQMETERELKRQNISEPVWVGLRQSRLFGFWIWYNGLRVGPWTNWKEGSPPEHQMSQHCGALEKVNGQYKWCDKDCRSKFRVLCEGK